MDVCDKCNRKQLLKPMIEPHKTHVTLKPSWVSLKNLTGSSLIPTTILSVVTELLSVVLRSDTQVNVSSQDHSALYKG